MIPFIVIADVHKKPYMEQTVVYEDMRIVMASNEEEAMQKYQEYWTSKSVEYSTTYTVYGYARETII
jgi:accessory colonization factor AcfC